MSGWVPIDKGLIRLLPDDRPYNYLEAMFSYTVDQNCGRCWTIRGYAILWKWSRNKVQKFIEEIRANEGHMAGRKGAGKGHIIRYIDAASRGEEGQKRANEGPIEGQKRVPTIKNKNKNKKEETTLSGKPSQVDEVFEYWKKVMDHPKAKLPGKRARAIRARLKDGYSVEDLKRAIDGCKLSPHHMGKNDQRKRYDDIELICRDATKTDNFIALVESGESRKIGGYTFD